MINLICTIIKHLTGLGHTELVRVAGHSGEQAIYYTPAINILLRKSHNYSFYYLPMESSEINIAKKRKLCPG